MRLPLRRDPSRVQHNDLVAQGKHFFAVVSDEENWDAVMLVPLAQIANKQRLRRTVQRSQWLIEQQHARFGHQSARQSDALALASRNLRRMPVAQVLDAKRLEHLVAAGLPLGGSQRTEPVRDVLFGS